MTEVTSLAALGDADAFLRMLGDRHTFQTFADGGAHRRDLSRILHGTLAEHAPTLATLNARGAGVFVMVNEGDRKGRKSGNVLRVRALFLDLDGAPLEPVKAAPLAPHCIVESSPNRWHSYWLVFDCSLPDFTPLQKQLAARFNGDPKVCDLARVMRLPGFDHRKGRPCRSRIVTLRAGSAYSVADIRAAFGFDQAPAPAIKRRTLPNCIPEGKRNETLFSLARGLVRQGIDAAGVNQRLQRINAERCKPPLCATEVDTIAANASAYGSDGFAMLPHRLLDSPEWKTLPPATHDVIVAAFRIHNGSNNGNIALTWADFESREGFANKNTFYRHRNAAVKAGILLRASEGRSTQTGRKPDLFAISSSWLRGPSQVSKIAPCASIEKVHPYIDKQPWGNLVPASGRRRTKTDKAA